MKNYDNLVSKLRHSRLVEQALEARPLVEQFCGLYNVSLVKILPTREGGDIEPMYYFNDNYGGYTIVGLIRSIEDYEGRIDC